MVRPPRLLHVAALCAVLVLACSSPAPDRPQDRPRQVILVSEAMDKEVGADVAERVAKEMGFVDDPALAAYVTAVGDRLAAGVAFRKLEADRTIRHYSGAARPLSRQNDQLRRSITMWMPAAPTEKAASPWLGGPSRKPGLFETPKASVGRPMKFRSNFLLAFSS